MIDKQDRKLIYAVLIFMPVMMLQLHAQLIPDSLQLLLLVCFFLFVAVGAIYCAASASKKKRRSRLFDYLFYAYAGIAALCVIAYSLSLDIIPVLAWIFYYPAYYFVMYIPLFFLMSLGTYLVAVRKNYKIGFVVFALAFLVILIYFASGYFLTSYIANDEELIAMYGTKALLNGMNPYIINMSRAVYFSSIYNSTGFTLTTNNTVVGTMSYPSLFFLSFVPFYMMGPATVAGLENTDLLVQSAVFGFVLLLVTWYAIDKQDILKPRYLLFLALIFFMSNLLSTSNSLMLALLLLAYAKLESRYSFVLLGLLLSFQEELWIPVLLLVAYSANTYGFRKGIRDILGAVGVFLLLNGYFILLNPGAYVRDILISLNNLLPSAGAPIGFFIFLHYTISIYAYSMLFALIIALTVLVSLYFNSKKAIPVLCFMPFMFLSHAQVPYYYFFAAMLVVVMYSKQERHRPGIIRNAIADNVLFRFIFFAIAAVVCIAAVAEVAQMHLDYVNGVNFSVSNQQAYFSGNNIYYGATLNYNSAAVIDNRIYVLLNAYGYPSGRVYGIDNVSLVDRISHCAFPCSININVVSLNPSNHTYSLNLVVHNATYQSYESVLVYNGAYAYNSGPVKVERAGS